jgi:small subunit ribosomal protein S6
MSLGKPEERKFLNTMRPYELVYIVSPDTDEQEFNGILEQLNKWIAEAEGKVARTDVWGRRRLAYPIRNFNEGIYVCLNLELPPQAYTLLDRNLRLTGKVMRHMLIRDEA